MLGKTGTGKPTLINSIINYVMGVDFEDNFRYKIIDIDFLVSLG